MMHLFTEAEREIAQKRVIAIAQADDRASGGALVGSYANNSEDRWSDVDVTFGIRPEFEPMLVLDEWTAQLKTEFDIIDYFDVRSSLAIYRVFLFSNGLEVDLSVVPEKEYGPMAPGFKLLFGKAPERKEEGEEYIFHCVGRCLAVYCF